MARKALSAQELLSASLLHAQRSSNGGIVRSADISRLHRERLIKIGWLQEIIKGWYVLVSPQVQAGSTAVWYPHFWAFARAYLSERFGTQYILSPESSLERHIDHPVIPKQLLVQVTTAETQLVNLPEGTSILIAKTVAIPLSQDLEGLRVMSVEAALARIHPSYLQSHPQEVRLAVGMNRSASELSRALMEHGTLASAERLIDALNAFGEKKKSAQVIADFAMTGRELRSSSPHTLESFQSPLPSSQSVHARRIEDLWDSMSPVVARFEPARNWIGLSEATIADFTQQLYARDAYNSLSIEGYEVTLRLIEKIGKGEWDPQRNERDRKTRDELAAKGYHSAFVRVLEATKRMFTESDPITALEETYQQWYRDLFAPCVQAGIHRAEEFVGFRSSPIYLRGSRHVPPRADALMDCMDAFFRKLRKEDNSFARAVLGHYVFVYIHPYVDGNGRLGRFILNSLLVSQRFNWTIVRTERKQNYLGALEAASVGGDIAPFSRFIVEEMHHTREFLTRQQHEGGESGGEMRPHLR